MDEEDDYSTDELLERLSEKQAEIEDLRRRISIREEQAENQAVREIVEDIAPVLHNLSTALEHDDLNEAKQGIETVSRQLQDALNSNGVSIISPSEGDTVDPEKHKVMATHNHDEKTGIIRIEREGYMYNETVLEPAHVIATE